VQYDFLNETSTHCYVSTNTEMLRQQPCLKQELNLWYQRTNGPRCAFLTLCGHRISHYKHLQLHFWWVWIHFATNDNNTFQFHISCEPGNAKKHKALTNMAPLQTIKHKRKCPELYSIVSH